MPTLSWRAERRPSKEMYLLPNSCNLCLLPYVGRRCDYVKNLEMGRSSWIIWASPEHNHVYGEGRGRSDTQTQRREKAMWREDPHIHTTHARKHSTDTHTHTQPEGGDGAPRRQPPGELHEVMSAPGLAEVVAHHYHSVTASYFYNGGKPPSQGKTQTSWRNLDEFPRLL